MTMREMFPSLWDRDEKAPVGFASLRKEMDRLFEEFAQNFRLPETGHIGKFDLAPDMDVEDTDKEVKLTVELPGVDEKDVDISVSGHTISISGEKKSESETKNGNGYRRERVYGSFHRQLTLPFQIDGDKVSAKSAKGVLTVTIPKPAEAVSKTKKVAISK